MKTNLNLKLVTRTNNKLSKFVNSKIENNTGKYDAIHKLNTQNKI